MSFVKSLALVVIVAAALAHAPAVFAGEPAAAAAPAALAGAEDAAAAPAQGCPGKPDGSCCGACGKLSPNVAAAKAAAGAAGCPCQQARAAAEAAAAAAKSE